MDLINKQDFFNTLSKKHEVFNCYSKLTLTHNNNDIYNIDNKNSNKPLQVVHTSNLFPSYLKPAFRNSQLVKTKIIPQKKIIGYAIRIDKNNGFDDFFKTRFSKSFRSNIKRFVNRFETCFNTNYKMFYGSISTTEYHTLMGALHTMLTKRFNQRDESNKMLEHWDFYMSTTYENINTKKASLFVIYHDDVPVQISLNYHFNSILFVAVPSYNIDYAKFSLGNISIYKLLEWAVENKYDIMDLEYGYLEYKRRWSNYIYEFSHHIIYLKNNPKASALGTFKTLKLKLKNFLKSINMDKLIESLKYYLKKQDSTYKAIEYKAEPIVFTNNSNLEVLNINSPQLATIKKIIFDFLFVNKVHVKNLKVYEIKPLKEYVFCCKSVTQKITID